MGSFSEETAENAPTERRGYKDSALHRSAATTVALQLCSIPSALAFWWGCGFIAVLMKVKGAIFDMDGTITAPYFDFNKIRDEGGRGDIDMLDYLGTAVGVEHARVTAVLKKFEDAGVDGAELNQGARELLDELARRGMPTALLTRNTRRSVDG